MRFSISLAAAAVLTVANAAKFTNTPQDFVSVKAGTPFNITWSDAAGPTTITLKNGVSTALKTVMPIASGQTGTSYLWTPPASLPDGTYAFEIVDTGAPNYSVQFPVTGGATASSASSISSSSLTSNSSSTTTPFSSTTTSLGNATTSANPTSVRTTSISTTSSTRSSSRTASTTTSGPRATPSDSNSAANIASPLVIVLLAFAAVMALQ